MALGEGKKRDRLLYKVRCACRLSYVLLWILFVVFVMLWLLPLLLSLFSSMLPHAFKWINSLTMSTPLDSLIFGLSPTAFIAIMMLILRDVSQGEIPFSRKQSKRIRLIAYFGFAQVICELLFSLVITALYPDGLVFLGYYVPSSTAPLIKLDFQALVFAIVCYCIFLVFEYGTLLQSDSDDIL